MKNWLSALLKKLAHKTVDNSIKSFLFKGYFLI